MELKNWFLEVVLKKMGPSAIRGAILGLSGWLITKNNLLEAFGVFSDPTAHVTVINWDKLSLALVALLPAFLAAFIKLINHQGKEFFPKKIAAETI